MKIEHLASAILADRLALPVRATRRTTPSCPRATPRYRAIQRTGRRRDVRRVHGAHVQRRGPARGYQQLAPRDEHAVHQPAAQRLRPRARARGLADARDPNPLGFTRFPRHPRRVGAPSVSVDPRALPARNESRRAPRRWSATGSTSSRTSSFAISRASPGKAASARSGRTKAALRLRRHERLQRRGARPFPRGRGGRLRLAR